MSQFLVSMLSCCLWTGVSAQRSSPVTDMQTEPLINPIGIDATRPRLSWRLGSSVEQAAYSLTFGADSTSLSIALKYRLPAGKNLGSTKSVI
jgi:alpha-L-rhamnosidase